jgi:hypothetical protein
MCASSEGSANDRPDLLPQRNRQQSNGICVPLLFLSPAYLPSFFLPTTSSSSPFSSLLQFLLFPPILLAPGCLAPPTSLRTTRRVAKQFQRTGLFLSPRRQATRKDRSCTWLARPSQGTITKTRYATSRSRTRSIPASYSDTLMTPGNRSWVRWRPGFRRRG